MKIGKLFLYFLGFVILGVMIDEGGAGLYTGENTLLWYLNNLLETKIYEVFKNPQISELSEYIISLIVVLLVCFISDKKVWKS
tara:strand:+ start:504 stop:752 length:249 start_codon:yes stop_codon:yes gene_type:complete